MINCKCRMAGNFSYYIQSMAAYLPKYLELDT